MISLSEACLDFDDKQWFHFSRYCRVNGRILDLEKMHEEVSSGLFSAYNECGKGLLNLFRPGFLLKMLDNSSIHVVIN